MADIVQEIRELAARYGVTARRQFVDDWTDKAGELSGEDGQQADEIGQLVINLGRAGAITDIEAIRLQLAYMRRQ